MKTFITAIAIMIAFCFLAPSNANAQINEILKRMDAHYKALESFKADVSREVSNSQLGETDNYSGNIYVVPDKKNPKNLRFRLNWIKPREESLSVINGKYELYVPAQGRLFQGSSSSKSVKTKGGSALAVMSMTKEEIKANYDLVYVGTESVSGTDTVRIKLTPKAKADFQYVELWVDGNGMPVQGKIVMPNNDTDQIRFSSIKKNVPLEASEFKIKYPSNVQKVKG